MSYSTFLAVFLGIPLILGCFVLRRELNRRSVIFFVVLSLVAILYTGPWDNAIVANGVWSYGPGRVSGYLVGLVPIEEYCFYVLQVGLAGLITLAVMRHWRG